MFGFYRLAAAVPVLRVADVEFNEKAILASCRIAAEQGADAVVFPELSLTGSSCGDLFFQEKLLQEAKEAACRIARATQNLPLIAVFGLPLVCGGRIYNVAAVAAAGTLCGIVPKTVSGKDDRRYFVSGTDLNCDSIQLGGELIPFGTDLLFGAGEELVFGIEFGSELRSVLPPSSFLAPAGACAIFTLAAEAEVATSGNFRRELVKQQSARCISAYLLTSAGIHESTTDSLFAGHSLIATNGQLCAENQRFNRESGLIFADIDFAALQALRRAENSFRENPVPELRRIPLPAVQGCTDFKYAAISAHPFIPEDIAECRERCEEILAIQCGALAKRIEHTQSKTLLIGISGGLDSTLALLVAAKCCEMLKRPASAIRALTMPGFGTSGRTKNNAVTLCKLLGVQLDEVDIKAACLLHFKDIGHDPAVLDTAYENVQARERTQILMDLANKSGGLVIGTGDLSEIALGWSTYNGDHMSMYAVNCSIPKTLIPVLIEHTAKSASPELAAVLRDVIATPVSPELLPAAADGSINQKTEDLVGPYELHDFFMYHFVRNGAPPEKIQVLAENAFQGAYDAAVIQKWLKTFLKRFFQQQFKRSCMPDGPKVGTIALSPRGDWRMPSDAMSSLWLK